ncbi:hypothetical protein [Deinococcus rubellus]
MSISEGVLWVLGTATALLALLRQARPNRAAPAPVRVSRPARRAHEEQR